MDDQSKEYVAKVADTPAIALTYDQRLDDYRHIVMQSFIGSDCQQKELNTLLDKLRIATERQKAIAHLPTMKGILEDKKAGLKAEVTKHMEFNLAVDHVNNALSNSDRRNPKTSPAQTQEIARAKQGMEQSKQTIGNLQKEIAVQERLIADMEKLIADGD